MKQLKAKVFLVGLLGSCLGGLAIYLATSDFYLGFMYLTLFFVSALSLSNIVMIELEGMKSGKLLVKLKWESYKLALIPYVVVGCVAVYVAVTKYFQGTQNFSEYIVGIDLMILASLQFYLTVRGVRCYEKSFYSIGNYFKPSQIHSYKFLENSKVELAFCLDEKNPSKVQSIRYIYKAADQELLMTTLKSYKKNRGL